MTEELADGGLIEVSDNDTVLAWFDSSYVVNPEVVLSAEQYASLLRHLNED